MMMPLPICFPRMPVRLTKANVARYSLPPDKDEAILFIEVLDRAVRAVDTWLKHGLALMMTRHNGTADEAARNATSLPVMPTAPNQPPDASS